MNKQKLSKETETKPDGYILLYAVSSGKLINDVLKDLCEKHSPKLWGEKYPEFEPKICTNKLGDGMQLIWFQTSDQRPYWWWVFVDSNWDMSESDYSLQVYDLIEDEFGSIPDEDDEDYNEDDYGDVMKCYPMIVKNDGILWGTQEFFSNSI
jgi:hypothetical protein